MSYLVHFLDTKTGARGTCKIAWNWSRYSERFNANVDDTYRWQFGSHSCDCTRLTYLYPDRYEEHLCNQGANRVLIERIIDEKGAQVYSEITTIPPLKGVPTH